MGLCPRGDWEWLVETVAALARIGVKHQYADALFAAALDHEEARLPLGPLLAPFQARMIFAIQKVAARHLAQRSSALPAAAAQDCLAISKAIIESEISSKSIARKAIVARVTHAIMGYLTYEAA